MRARAACFTLIAAAAAMCCIGSAAANSNGVPLAHEKIFTDKAHPNVVTITIEGMSGHRLLLAFGGPEARPTSLSIKLEKAGYFASSGSGWSHGFYTPRGKLVLKATYPSKVLASGHKPCWHLTILKVDRTVTDGPDADTCINGGIG